MPGQNPIDQRRTRHFDLNSQFSHLDTATLLATFPAPEEMRGWGRNHIMEMGGTKVFVKRVPLTDLEVANDFSTANLFRLPTYYNYGVGSAGFGAVRELVAHIKTTNWVLNGEIENFPLLYHHRIVPIQTEPAPVDEVQHQGYVDYWDGNENIGEYIRARAAARHELVLFLEFVPHVLQSWLAENPVRTLSALDQLFSTVAFLREKGVIHFDAHFHNILSDGDLIYLTDFGLVLDKNFTLSEAELAFYDEHIDYDYARIISCLGFALNSRCGALSEAERARLTELTGIPVDTKSEDLFRLLLTRIQELNPEILRLDPSYVDCLARFQPTYTLVQDFYSQLRSGRKQDAKFPKTRLREQLKSLGLV